MAILLMYTADLVSIPYSSAVGSVQLQLCNWGVGLQGSKVTTQQTDLVAMAKHRVNTRTQHKTGMCMTQLAT